MTIAIDYDNTWTQDPKMWNNFILLAQACGHTVIMVTARSGWSSDMERGNLPANLKIIYTNRNLKKPHVQKYTGFKVDVWIDDMPGTIEECRILEDQKL